MTDRRTVLEAIAYGSDPKITPSDRLKALDGLREFETFEPDIDDLPEDEIWAEVDSWHSMMLGSMFIASGGPEFELDPAQFPKTAQRLREVVGRMTERALAASRSLESH
jgi:hypothetical protein